MTQSLSSRGIGASEIAAACGFSRYKSRFELWLQKTGRAPAFAGNIHTRLGQLCEPRARQLYADATGQDVEIPPCSVFHPEVTWARCTPDGRWVSDPGVKVQIKCVGYFVGRRWKFSLPIEVEAQCQWELFVDGGHRVDLAVLVGSDELEWERFLFGEPVDPQEIMARASLEVFTIHRSETDIAALLTGATAFWRMVETDTQPPVDYSDGCADYLNGHRIRGHVDLDVADSDILAAVDEFRDAYTEELAVKKRLARAKNAVREHLSIAKATRIKATDGHIVWTTNHQLRAPKSWGDEEETEE